MVACFCFAIIVRFLRTVEDAGPYKVNFRFLALRRLSIRMLENLFFDFLLERFLEGVRGNAFSREKGSPAFLLIYLSSQKDSRYSSKRARGGRRSGKPHH